MSNFSQDSITAVLLLLPGKSLLRFKCVSKAFRSEIEDPSFVKMHLHKSMETGTHLNLVVQDQGERCTEQFRLFSMSDLECGLLRPIQIPFPTSWVCESSSCHGLAYDWVTRMLWNPLTRRYKIIPYCPSLDLIEYWFEELSYTGFGYDSANDDYQIVQLSMKVDRLNDDYRPLWPDFQVWVYSLRSNCWGKIETSTNVFLGARYLPDGVFVDGALHWVLTTGFLKSTDSMISTFNLTTKEFGRLPVPDYQLPKDDGIIEYKLYNLGGRLAWISEYGGQDRWMGGYLNMVEIHVIEKRGNGMEVTWNKLFRFTREEVPEFPMFVRHSNLVAVSKKDNKFVMSGYDEFPFSCFDPRENTVEEFSFSPFDPKENTCYCAFSCWESLVDLGSDSEKSEKKIFYKFEQKDDDTSSSYLTLGDMKRLMWEQVY